jgi:nucleoside-diphosphate-sugar epimerase
MLPELPGSRLMTNKKVVLTGAHSYLGQKLLSHLLTNGGYELAAFITPWANDSGLATGEGIRYVKADLTEPLSDESASFVREADRVLHFAWIRGKSEDDVLESNLAMLANLQAHLSRPETLVFISSVAASPNTLSRYGRTKFKIANKLLEDGAIVLVTGLIVDKEPKGPYKLLVDVVRKYPFSVRFSANSVKVYPIRTDDFLSAITTVLTSDPPSGSYRVYPSNAADINEFLGQLEKKYQRGRVKVPVSHKISVGSLRGMHRAKLLPATLGEKLLTFLYKDEDYLVTHRTLEGTESIDRPLEEMI